MLVCAMRNGGYSAYVEDTGAQMYGQQLCSSFLTQGWNEDTAAENEVAKASAAASASAANAAAATSAAQAAADQLSRDESAATQLVSSLRGVPGQLSDSLKTMDGYVQQTLDDLARTKEDAAHGQGDTCYNVSTVAYDATSNVGYDATNDVGYDATNDVGYVIKQARDDLVSLRGAIQRITGEGGAIPPDAAPVSSSATSAIAAAITQTNSDVDKAHAAAAAAYGIAAGLATGNCSGYATGAFQPVQHIG